MAPKSPQEWPRNWGLEIINSEIVVPHIAGSLGLEHSSVQRYVDGKATLFDRWQIDTRKVVAIYIGPHSQSGSERQRVIRGWGAAALFQGIQGVICVRGLRADGTTCARHDGTARCQGCRRDPARDRAF